MEAQGRLLELARALSNARAEDTAGILAGHFAGQAVHRFYAPFEQADTPEAASEVFWTPLRQALPDFSIQPAISLQGEYEGYRHASLLGFVVGNFIEDLVGIPPTCKLTTLRFAMNAVYDGATAIACFVMFDLLELIRLAGYFPLRPMPGSPIEWLFPLGDFDARNDKERYDTLEIIREMQRGLPAGPAVVDRASAAAHHSPHWAARMNWFGPAGIGSSRGMEGFRDSHGALFLRAFQDRCGIARAADGPVERPGHFCEIGDGNLAMTAGWPAMRGRHTGSQWLGLPPTGKEIEMRVADWYRLDQKGRITDNWVMMDIPHMLEQMGLNVFEDLPFAADPTLSRLP